MSLGKVSLWEKVKTKLFLFPTVFFLLWYYDKANHILFIVVFRGIVGRESNGKSTDKTGFIIFSS